MGERLSREIARRSLLRRLGGGLVSSYLGIGYARGLSGLPPSDAEAHIPTLRQTRRLNLLTWTSFVRDEDIWFQENLQETWAKPNGVELSVELVSNTELQPKIVAALQAGAGPDVVLLKFNWAHLYADKLLDLSDIAERNGPAGGGYYPLSQANCRVRGSWRSVPFGILGNAIAYRESILATGGGISLFPGDWSSLRDVAARVRASNPDVFFGQAVSHAFGDAPTFLYPYLWAHGAAEVDESGTVVTLNSEATELALTTFKEFFEVACDPQCLAWDDSSNNRAYLAGQVWATNNAASIYIAALSQAPQIAADTQHALLPAGPKGRFVFADFHSFAIPAYVRDPSPARELLSYLTAPETVGAFLKAGKGYQQAPFLRGETDLWPNLDPKFDAFKEVGRYSGWFGYPGPPSPQAVEAAAKYIVADMFAAVLTGTPPRQAMAAAEAELRNIYR